MATSISTAQGTRYINPRYSGFGGGEGGHSPRSSFDADVPAGVDPEGSWRFSNSSRGRRTGATSAERAGDVAGYTPGYGRSSNQNTSGGLTPRSQWDSLFTPRLTQQFAADKAAGDATRFAQSNPSGSQTAALGTSPMPGAGMSAMAMNAARGVGVSPVLPPAATPPPQSPIPMPPSTGEMSAGQQPSPVVGSIAGHPMDQAGSPGNLQRQVTGLPPGQRANASLVQGQNSPQNLATRRKPVDPLAT